MLEYQDFETRDGARRVQFEGVKLAHSSSESPGKPRWVEFTLYRTRTGQFVVYRVGRSYVYHTRNCPIVVKNRLSMYMEENLPARYTPCQDCKPSIIEIDGHYPETSRYYTQPADSVEGVIAILSKEDKAGIRYLTNVAKDLLYKASQVDEQVRNEFFSTRID